MAKNVFSVRLSAEDHAKMRKIAEKQSRSLSNMIEYLCKTEITKYEQANGPIPLTEEDLYEK